jgi:acyl-CoA synthetase (AMP-forming)/AMP-acid ligase II
MFTISVTFPTAEAAAAFLTASAARAAAVVELKAALADQPKAIKAETKAETKAVEYPVLQKAVFELAGKDKAKALEVCASMGVKSFKELAPEQYGPALDAVKAAIDALNTAAEEVA